MILGVVSLRRWKRTAVARRSIRTAIEAIVRDALPVSLEETKTAKRKMSTMKCIPSQSISDMFSAKGDVKIRTVHKRLEKERQELRFHQRDAHCTIHLQGR